MLDDRTAADREAALDRAEREVREAIREFVALARFRHAARLILLGMVEDATR